MNNIKKAGRAAPVLSEREVADRVEELLRRINLALGV